MRIKKLMNDSFYSNHENFSGVTSVDSLTTDLYFHFTDKLSDKWKLSGNTAARVSGLILEDSYTTSIVVTPSSITGSTGGSQQLSVVNQTALNVISECAFSATSSKVTITTGGLISFVATGVTSVTVRHSDILSTPTTVPIYLYYPGTASAEASFSGFTGTTHQITVTMNTGGYDVTNSCIWSSDDITTATVVNGLVTFTGVGITTIRYTYTPSASGTLSVTGVGS